MSSDYAIRFDAVSKHYRRRSGRAAIRDVISSARREPFRALDDVSFVVEPGDAFGLIGDNGAGKNDGLTADDPHRSADRW